MKITGQLTAAEGTIWVWAESDYHDKQLTPFASLDGVSVNAEQLKAFRNARDDSTTNNRTDSWLYGTSHEDNQILVYWNGIEGSRSVDDGQRPPQ